MPENIKDCLNKIKEGDNYISFALKYARRDNIVIADKITAPDSDLLNDPLMQGKPPDDIGGITIWSGRYFGGRQYFELLGLQETDAESYDISKRLITEAVNEVYPEP